MDPSNWECIAELLEMEPHTSNFQKMDESCQVHKLAVRNAARAEAAIAGKLVWE